MVEVSKVFEIEDFKGCCFEVEVYAYLEEGGSNSFGSDEPEWVDCTITNIYRTDKFKKVSDRLYSKLEKEYSEWFEESLIEDYYHGY